MSTSLCASPSSVLTCGVEAGKFARETASPLNLFRISALRFVASVCNSIARCTLTTTFMLSSELKNSTEVVPQFLHPLKKSGLLAVV